MSVADRLLKRLESNISQSLGVRQGAPPGPGATPGVPRESPAAPGPNEGRMRARSLGLMDIRKIVPDPRQPRRDFDPASLGRLSESLKKFGQLLPIRVRWDGDLGRWIIISGERRYRAALAAGLEAVTCHFVEEDLPGSRVLEERLVENCLREDLKPVEQAEAYRALMEANGWSARKVAEELQLASSTVVKALALLKLPEEVRRQVDAGAIPATAAYELAKLKEARAQEEIGVRIAAEGLSRDETVRLVRKAAGRPGGPEGRRGSERTGAVPPPTPVHAPCPAAAIAERHVYQTEERAILTYSFASRIELTIAAPREATGSEIATALASALEELRERLSTARGDDLPWFNDPAHR